MAEKNVCPVCGGEVQPTKVLETDFSLCGDLWEYRNSETTDVRVYCENDHKLSMDDYPELTARNMRPLSAAGIQGSEVVNGS